MYDLTQKNVDKIPKKDWMELIELIPEIENILISNEKSKSNSEGELIFNYSVFNEVISKFHKVVYEKKIVLVFDWGEWNEGKEILENGRDDYNTFDLMTLVKLISTIVRNDRFCEGYLDSKFEDGTVLKVLNRIKSIIDKE